MCLCCCKNPFSKRIENWMLFFHEKKTSPLSLLHLFESTLKNVVCCYILNITSTEFIQPFGFCATFCWSEESRIYTMKKSQQIVAALLNKRHNSQREKLLKFRVILVTFRLFSSNAKSKTGTTNAFFRTFQLSSTVTIKCVSY